MMNVYSLFCSLSYIQQSSLFSSPASPHASSHAETTLTLAYLVSSSRPSGWLYLHQQPHTMESQKLFKKCPLVKGPPFPSTFILTQPLQVIIINYLGFLESQSLNFSVERGLLSGTRAPIVPHQRQWTEDKVADNGYSQLASDNSIYPLASGFHCPHRVFAPHHCLTQDCRWESHDVNWAVDISACVLQIHCLS